MGTSAVAVAIPERERAWLEVEHGSIAHNVRAMKDLLGDHTDLMAIVKADGYGLGAVSVARTALAEGASSLGVATVQEGLELRFSGIEAPILGDIYKILYDGKPPAEALTALMTRELRRE